MQTRPATSVVSVIACALVLGVFLATPSPAQGQEYSLFDKFSIGLGGSSISFDTKIRLDSEALDGTEIDFEDTLGLGSSEFTPSLSFSLRAGKRHLISTRYDGSSRDSTETISTEIVFGELVIPIDATVKSSLDVDELLLNYTYFPWLRDRWAFGIGLGVRFLDLTAKLRVTDVGGNQALPITREKASASAPAPFLNLDYRYAISEKWRLLTEFGFIDIDFDDFSGSQSVLAVKAENLAGRGWSWGFGGSYSAVDIDVDGSDWAGSLKFDIFRGGVFVKARFN